MYNINSEDYLSEGTEIARFRRWFSFVLQQVLSFHTLDTVSYADREWRAAAAVSSLVTCATMYGEEDRIPGTGRRGWGRERGGRLGG